MSRQLDTAIFRRDRSRVRAGWLAAWTCVGFLLFVTSASALPISAFVISEVMYDPVGANDGSQWIELYNGTASAIDLSEYEIQWGRLFLSDSVGLAGTLAPGSTFVIGGPTSDSDNGNPIYDQIFDFAPDLGDGGHSWQEDGIALVETATGTMQHTVVYGGNGFMLFPTFFDEQGNAATVIDDSALNPGESLEYLGNGNWQVQPTPTDGAPHPNLVPVPEPTPLVLVGLGLVAMAAIRSAGREGGAARGTTPIAGSA